MSGPVRRRAVAAGLGATLGAAVARAQPAAAKRRIGIVTASTNAPFVEGMKLALREAGHEEGRNLEILYGDGKGRAELIEQAVGEMVRANVEVLVVWATGAAEAAVRATQRIPIVAQVADATGTGLVKSMARPEGNITGVSSLSFPLAGKRVELLLEALPSARALAFVGLAGEPNVRRFYEFAQKATRPGVEQRLVDARGIEEFESVVSPMRAQLDGLTMQQIFQAHSAALGAMAQRLKLPACGLNRSFAHGGGLMAVEWVPEEGFRHMARCVDRLLVGVPVANLPFLQPSRTFTIVNLRAAAALGLAIPPTLLARADEVIE